MPVNILLVSNSADERQKIIEALSEFNLLTASSEEEVKQVFEEHEDIYLMLLDVDTSAFDGTKLLRFLKSDEKHKYLRTIVLSDCDQRGKAVEDLTLGIVDCKQKPLNFEFLRAKVRIQAEMIKCQETIRKQAQDQTMILETIFEQVPIGIGISLDEDSDLGGANKLFSYNPEFVRICERSKEELMNIGWNAITHPEDLAEETELFLSLMRGEINRYSLDKRIMIPDGSFKWVHIISVPLHFSETDGFHYAALMQDIDKEKRTYDMLMESERSKSVLLSNLQGMAYRCKYDRDWTMEFVSSGCGSLCGCRSESLLNNKEFSYNELIAPEYRERIWRDWEKALAAKKRFHHEYEIIDANGARKWVMEMGEGVFNEDGTVEALEGIIFDISDRKAMENKLR
ncbi:MAG: PAS domain-containing protein, partial [Clostridiaceae bacterium]|nr:PAS domain-containing protein [Clostridiaceae bacterium]